MGRFKPDSGEGYWTRQNLLHFKWSFTGSGNRPWQVRDSAASWHCEGMFLAKHSLQRKLGQPSGTFIMCTCHQPDPVLKWTEITHSGPSSSENCKGQYKPIVGRICEFGRSSQQTKANTHIVSLRLEFLNTLFIEFWNSKWIWSVLKKHSVPWLIWKNIYSCYRRVWADGPCLSWKTMPPASACSVPLQQVDCARHR